jgi:serine/threonine protein kinase
VTDTAPGTLPLPEVPGLTDLSVFARGGYATVYRATQQSVGREVAVKVENRTLDTERDQRRFLREARAAASLDSPHVVRILEVSDPESPLPFIAMERLRGDDLGHLLRQRRALSSTEIIDMVAQIARGLDAARAAQIVHRDI